MRFRRGVRDALVAFLVTLASPPAMADLVSLAITPVSVHLTVKVENVTVLVASPGPSTASVSSSFAGPLGQGGSVNAAASILSDHVLVDVSGVLSTLGSASEVGIDVTASVTLAIDVPDIGDAHTPLFTDFEGVVDTGMWQQVRLGAAPSGLSFGFLSSVLGKYLVPEAGDVLLLAWRDSAAVEGSSFVSAIPGDVLEFSIAIQVVKRTSTIGSFLTSVPVRFRVPTPTVGTGDVNGDDVFDIVDVTIMRRALAGLPPWP